MSLMICTDVTAVKLHNNLILAGIGSYLNTFKKLSYTLLQRILCLNGQKIYGIVPSTCSEKILIFGGKQWTVISECNGFVRDIEPLVCDDWLHSGVWITDREIALLTAHNVVQMWDISSLTLLSKHTSKENSILYSGALQQLQGDVLVLAGTVFSEVIIHACKADMALHHLKGHRGVIFSISCDLHKGLIVTTSDDRSVCIWGVNNIDSLAHFATNTIEFWQKATIVRRHELYGHTARVMRSCITNDMVVSVGEDSVISFWSIDGEMLKKIVTHQNGGIWSVDADDKHLVTGGGDGGVILHPLSVATDSGESDVLKIDEGTPKKLVFTARRNIVVLNDKDELIYFDVQNKTKNVNELKHESTYKLLSLSSCKQMVAVIDMCGNLDIFIETCKNEALLLNIINSKVDFGKVLSLHWAGNRHLVLGCDGGLIKVLASKANKIEEFGEFTLPSCKERWLTAASIDTTNTLVIVGDRCGNIHVYKKGIKIPMKSFSKVHGRYGPTSIAIKNNRFLSTGRDGTVKYFDLDIKKVEAQYMSKKDLEFQWVEKFIDKNENIVCGFQERVFVVYDLKNNSQLVEEQCGGGHRSWDVVRYIEKIGDDFEECIKFMYVKNSDINLHTFVLSKMVSTNVVFGSHFKEINCFKTINVESSRFCVCGGEDTTLRISSLHNSDLQDKMVFKHLSNVRTLKTKHLVGGNKYIVVSGGGRAQICIKLIDFIKENNEVYVKSQDLVDYMIKGPEKERKGKQSWKNCTIDFDPETRIMDIDLLQNDEVNFIVFAGCSDACLRVFEFNMIRQDLKLVKELKDHKTCILKTHYFKVGDKNILGTCSTRGEVIFWNVTDFEDGRIDVEPMFKTHTNKSGINCFDVKVLSEKSILFCTGGDDNAIHLNLLEITGESEINTYKMCDKWSTDRFHCSQVTGLVLLDNLWVSTSIDQRVTICSWSVKDGEIKCEFVSQMYSDVSDIQGMDVVDVTDNKITISVFGKGVEMIALTIPG